MNPVRPPSAGKRERGRAAMLAALFLLSTSVIIVTFRGHAAAPAALSAARANPRMVGAAPIAPLPVQAPWGDRAAGDVARGIPRAARGPEPELTAAQLLARVAGETPRPIWNRFLEGMAKEPALRRALADFHRTRGDSAPAHEFIGALMARREFPKLVSGLTGMPGFRRTYERLSLDRAVVRAVRASSASNSRPAAAAATFAAAARGGGRENGTLRDEDRKTPGAQPGGYDVQTRLGKLRSGVGEQNIFAYLPSAFVSMPRAEKERLENACEEHGFCDAVAACRVANLWASCYAACHKSGKCPAELLRPTEPDTPILYRGG